MLMDKLPPELTMPERPERPGRTPLPPGLGTWSFLMQCENARFRLVTTRRGVNLFIQGADKYQMRASWHLHALLNLHRGFRAIQRDQEVFDRYLPRETNDPREWFLCSLPTGNYAIVAKNGGDGNVLWWYDPADVDDKLAQPKLPPELRHVRQRPLPPVKPTIKKATLKPARGGIAKANLR